MKTHFNFNELLLGIQFQLVSQRSLNLYHILHQTPVWHKKAVAQAGKKGTY